ncbi:MAG: hypothetical protein QNJ70_20400 [Xenococcaceae cyanobacterium MO_207.B15]|nr:hypothetical protein [Xenococcaceae cyanobacterium MO_207.B15]
MWIKVFELDNSGTRRFGDLGVLLEAVEKGAAVRVRISEPDGREMFLENLFEVTTKNNHVFAIGTFISNDLGSNSQNPELVKGANNLPYNLYFIAGTNGYYHLSRWDFKGNELQTTSDPRGSAWYVGS